MLGRKPGMSGFRSARTAAIGCVAEMSLLVAVISLFPSLMSAVIAAVLSLLFGCFPA
jgi:hypothetical protein